MSCYPNRHHNEWHSKPAVLCCSLNWHENGLQSAISNQPTNLGRTKPITTTAKQKGQINRIRCRQTSQIMENTIFEKWLIYPTINESSFDLLKTDISPYIKPMFHKQAKRASKQAKQEMVASKWERLRHFHFHLYIFRTAHRWFSVYKRFETFDKKLLMQLIWWARIKQCNRLGDG